MLSIESRLQIIDPERLLVVDFATSRQPLVVLRVDYVSVVDANGMRRVAIEIIYDPTTKSPSNFYTCAVERLQREILAPANVRKVRPYK